MEIQTKLLFLLTLTIIFIASLSSANLVETVKEIVQVVQQNPKQKTGQISNQSGQVCTEELIFRENKKCTCTGNVRCDKSQNSITCVNKEGNKCYETFCMQNPKGSCICIRTQLSSDCVLGGPIAQIPTLK